MNAEMTGVDVCQIVANGATADCAFDFKNGFGKLCGFGFLHFQNEKCQPLGGFGSNAREFSELLDEAIDGFCDVSHLK